MQQRVASRHSEISDQELEGEGQAKAELASLQRQYRIMECNHKAYCEESQNNIGKQRTQIALLKAEYDEIQVSLTLTQSVRNSKRDSFDLNRIQNLLSEEEEYEKAIQDKHIQVRLLDQEICELEKEILAQKKNMGTVHSDQLQHFRRLKQGRVLENRLNKATVDFNKLLTTNSKLREKIDHLRSQRVVFGHLHEKLTKELHEQKKNMQEIVEQSTLSYDQSDDAQAKMLALRERNEKDLAQYNKEYKNFLRNVDHDAKLQIFMDVKSQERTELEEEAAKRRAGEQDRAVKTAEETIELYRKVLGKIKEVTGEENVALLAKRFIDTERETLSLFNFVNELNNEVEQLQEQIDAINRHIKRSKDEGAQYQEEREKILGDLFRKLQWKTKEAESLNKQREANFTTFVQAKIGIKSVFDRIECDRSAIAAKLGDSDGVNESNIIQYLRTIEQKADKLLQIHTYLQLKEQERKSSSTVPLEGTASLLGPVRIVLTPPSTENDREDDDNDIVDVGRPMTRDEMKAKILCSIQKRESRGQYEATAVGTQETTEPPLKITSRDRQKKR